MNVLVVGGSNSRMQAGYTKWLVEELATLGRPVERFDNLALGANSCLLGLVSLCEFEGEPHYDAVVIEYSVNDYAMMVSGDLPLWRAAYEGLLRQVCRRWPRALVCCVLLGRSNMEPALWARQMEETHRIASHYPAVVIADAQAQARELGWPDERIYADPMHYSAEMQERAGGLAARSIAGRRQQDASMPAPLNDIVFDPVGLLDLGALDEPRSRTFSNSVVHMRTLELHLGERVNVQVPGAPICIVFVSSQGCGSFRMVAGDREALVHTLHDGVRDGKHAFLPLSAYGTWWRDNRTDWRLTLFPVADAQGPADWPTFHVVPSAEPQPVVCFSKILYRLA